MAALGRSVTVDHIPSRLGELEFGIADDLEGALRSVVVDDLRVLDGQLHVGSACPTLAVAITANVMLRTTRWVIATGWRDSDLLVEMGPVPFGLEAAATDHALATDGDGTDLVISFHPVDDVLEVIL